MPAVLAYPGLDNTERELISAIWAEATDAAHWVQPGPRTPGASLRAQLHAKFPWLKAHVRDAVMRAASYEWK